MLTNGSLRDGSSGLADTDHPRPADSIVRSVDNEHVSKHTSAYRADRCVQAKNAQLPRNQLPIGPRMPVVGSRMRFRTGSRLLYGLDRVLHKVAIKLRPADHDVHADRGRRDGRWWDACAC